MSLNFLFFYVVIQYVCKDTLELTVHKNVLILVTQTNVRELATAALTYATVSGAAELLTLLPQVGTLNFIIFVNIYTFPSQNNYKGNDALLNVLKRKYVMYGFNVGKIFALINKHVNQNIALTKQCAASSKLKLNALTDHFFKRALFFRSPYMHASEFLSVVPYIKNIFVSVLIISQSATSYLVTWSMLNNSRWTMLCLMSYFTF